MQASHCQLLILNRQGTTREHEVEVKAILTCQTHPFTKIPHAREALAGVIYQYDRSV